VPGAAVTGYGRDVAPEFLFLGRPCLDLAHTGDVEERWRPFEAIGTPAALARWLAAAPPGVEVRRPTPDAVAAAHRLRRAVWDLVDAALAGQPLPAPAVRTVNRLAAGPDLTPELVGTGALRLRATADRALATIARDAVLLFGDPSELARVRECESEDCRIVFYDGSPPNRRRWCFPERCGDRQRARTYRARHREEQPA
jgi:predicted RNA-binding Zn ribbon-like protein